MTQNYTNIQSTDIVGESLTPLKNRDQANKTNFMGTGFPEVTSEDVGMTCVIIKTENGVDYKQVWRLIGVVDNQPQWLLERDLTKGIVYSDTISDHTITSYQEANTLLTSLSTQEATGQQSNANKVPYLSSTNTFALADITAKARDFLAAVDAAEQRGVLGLGSLATKNSITGSDIAANTVALSNMATGTYKKVISYTSGGAPTLIDLPAGVPVGAVLMWFSPILPSDNTWIFLAGQQLSKTEYADLWEFASSSQNITADSNEWLYTRKGAFYNESDSTFRVPDIRNYFLRPWDGPEGPTRLVGAVQGDAIRNITGTAVVTSGQDNFTTDGAFTVAAIYGNSVKGVGGGWYNETLQLDASRVVPTANENRPTNIAIPYIMKAKK